MARLFARTITSSASKNNVYSAPIKISSWFSESDCAVESAVKISQGFNQYGELTQFQVNNHNPLNLSYDKLGRQTRKQNQNGFILAEHFSPSGLLQAQGGGWNNSLTE